MYVQIATLNHHEKVSVEIFLPFTRIVSVGVWFSVHIEFGI